MIVAGGRDLHVVECAGVITLGRWLEHVGMNGIRLHRRRNLPHTHTHKLLVGNEALG